MQASKAQTHQIIVVRCNTAPTSTPQASLGNSLYSSRIQPVSFPGSLTLTQLVFRAHQPKPTSQSLAFNPFQVGSNLYTFHPCETNTQTKSLEFYNTFTMLPGWAEIVLTWSSLSWLLWIGVNALWSGFNALLDCVRDTDFEVDAVSWMLELL